MAVGDTYEVALVGLCQSQQIVNVFHFRAEAAGDLSTSIASDINTNAKASFLACLPTNYTLTTIRCRQINPPGPIGVDFTPTGTVAGNVAIGPGDMTACAVIKWTSGYVGRSRRGRTFHGPLGQQQISLGALVSGQVTLEQTFVSTWLGRYGPSGTFAATARMVIWSHHIATITPQGTPPAMGDPASASAYVLAGSVGLVVRTQRRRQLNVGA